MQRLSSMMNTAQQPNTLNYAHGSHPLSMQGLSFVPTAAAEEDQIHSFHDEQASQRSSGLTTESDGLAGEEEEFSDCVDCSDAQGWESGGDVVSDGSFLKVAKTPCVPIL